VRTLGIDLAAQPAKTAACVVEWSDDRALVTEVRIGADDDALLDRINSADKVGIDAPFGWPDEFVEAISTHSGSGGWAGRDRDQRDYRETLVFRETDRRMIAAGSRPLSVSTDRIGITAMRCAHVLDQVAARGEFVDRAGRGKLAEVYPAAALRRWGFNASGYKRPAGRGALGELMTDLESRAPWLDITAADADLCRRSDDAFDALVAALVTRAAARELTELPPDDQMARASREGWIHLPSADSLDLLPAR
jgi:predicted nuclease with RNAse H fold